MGTTLCEFGWRTLRRSWARNHHVQKIPPWRAVTRGFSQSSCSGWCSAGLLDREGRRKRTGEGTTCQTVETPFWLIRRQKITSKPDSCHNATAPEGQSCYFYFSVMTTCTHVPSLNSRINGFSCMDKIKASMVPKLLSGKEPAVFYVHFGDWVPIP